MHTSIIIVIRHCNPVSTETKKAFQNQKIGFQPPANPSILTQKLYTLLFYNNSHNAQ